MPSITASVLQVETICPHIGVVYSGMGPDYRVIVKHARHEAAAYKQRYGEDIPTEQLVQTVAEIFQVVFGSWPIFHS